MGVAGGNGESNKALKKRQVRGAPGCPHPAQPQTRPCDCTGIRLHYGPLTPGNKQGRQAITQSAAVTLYIFYQREHKPTAAATFMDLAEVEGGGWGPKSVVPSSGLWRSFKTMQQTMKHPFRLHVQAIHIKKSHVLTHIFPSPVTDVVT